tara:strand:- start:171 stop:413 length:243 start_codon:yes stop_codon:yes gene_type:complete
MIAYHKENVHSLKTSREREREHDVHPFSSRVRTLSFANPFDVYRSIDILKRRHNVPFAYLIHAMPPTAAVLPVPEEDDEP